MGELQHEKTDWEEFGRGRGPGIEHRCGFSDLREESVHQDFDSGQDAHRWVEFQRGRPTVEDDEWWD